MINWWHKCKKKRIKAPILYQTLYTQQNQIEIAKKIILIHLPGPDYCHYANCQLVICLAMISFACLLTGWKLFTYLYTNRCVTSCYIMLHHRHINLYTWHDPEFALDLRHKICVKLIQEQRLKQTKTKLYKYRNVLINHHSKISSDKISFTRFCQTNCEVRLEYTFTLYTHSLKPGFKK